MKDSKIKIVQNAVAFSIQVIREMIKAGISEAVYFFSLHKQLLSIFDLTSEEAYIVIESSVKNA